MTKASDNAFPSILVTEGTEPTAPAAGKQRVYIDSTSHHLSRTDSSGTQVDLETNQAAGGMATDALWDAAGDLAVGTGANTGGRLAIGASGKVPASNGTTLAYIYPPGYEFNYTESTTASTSITATTGATADTIITASGGVAFDGSTTIYVEFSAPQARPDATAAGRFLHIVIYDDTGGGAAEIGRLGTQAGPAAAADTKPILLRTNRLTPSNATHTYSIRGYVNAGTGVVAAGAGGSDVLVPMYIRVFKA